MAYTQFKKLDVKSMEQLYEKKERKRRQRAEVKRQQECEVQQQQQQHRQPQFPSTALAIELEQNFGILSATEAQTTSWTSSDPFDSIGNFEFDSRENLGIDEAYTPCDFASLESIARSCEIRGILSTIPKPTFSDDINPHAQSWLPRAPLPAQPSTEQTLYNETNPSSVEELPSALDLARRATGQLRLANHVISGINTSVVEVDDSSENCDVVETSDDGNGSDDDETDVENCHREIAVPEFELTRKEPSGSPVLRFLPESSTTAPTCRESPSVASGLCLSGPAEAEAPVGSLCGQKKPQTGGFSLHTPVSDHASDSGQSSQVVTHRRKRGFKTTESGCEGRDLRPVKRVRPWKVDNGSKSPALPTRTLRALPSRVPAENSSNKLSNEIKTQPRRSAGTPPQSEADCPVDWERDGKATLRPDRLFISKLDYPPKRSIYQEAQRVHSPTISDGPSLRPNHPSSTHNQTEKCGLVPPPPVTTKVNPPAAACHTCGFSSKHLIRMINTFEALNGGSARLSEDGRRSDMLELFLGFIKNYAMERLPHNEPIMEQNEIHNATHQDHAAEAPVGLSHSDTFKLDDDSDDNADDNDSQSNDQSDSGDSDHYSSPDSVEKNIKMSKRRRWTGWEEERLRAYIKEGKEWSWIANKLRRSEPAVTQHWVIIERQDKETAN